MLEWLLGFGFVFAPILKSIGQEAAKDWLKDFFKGVPGKLSERAIALVLPDAREKAFKAFFKLFQAELEANGLDRAQMKLYRESLDRFRRRSTVQQLLGSAFRENCQGISAIDLAREWQAISPRPLPVGFKWELIATPYYREVRRIRREDEELRAILDSENLERLGRNSDAMAQAMRSLAGIIPEFDLQQYRESLVESYGTLKLSAVDCTHDQYRMRLWSLFIAQNVREVLPPSRYEIPKELEERWRDAGLLEGNFAATDARRYRESYWEKPARSVLEALKQTRYAVILGDPGSGKSTLLQYLALSHFETPLEDIAADELPLLVELRKYAADTAKPSSIVEFFHKGNNAIQKLNQENLHQLLKAGRAWVLLDGLDEIFDPLRREEVVTEICRFTNEYPKVRAVVTSRVIGYNPDRLRDAGFTHLTLQDLEPEQVDRFIQLWYDFALDNDPDKELLQQRLHTAIDNSKALKELAGNPLLLTMMAILNRRQELPRDRATLYDEASKVLLYAWDIDHKRLQLPADTLARQEKQAILREVAFAMQAGEKGLKGNIIDRDRLLELVTQFLAQRSYSQPREKAEAIVNQLRERNFILCYLGNDCYGFVHRTFLEFFCAWSFVERFEKQRVLTQEELIEETFGKHWQDESWHEVLRLIAGMVDERVTGSAIEYLMAQESDELVNLILAAECLSELKDRFKIQEIAEQLLKRLKREGLEHENRGVAKRVLHAIAQHYKDNPATLPLLKSYRVHQDLFLQAVAIKFVADYYSDNPETLPWLMSCLAMQHQNIRASAIGAIAKNYKKDPKTFSLLKTHLKDQCFQVRNAALRGIAQHYKEDQQTFIVLQVFLDDEESWVRSTAIQVIAEFYQKKSEVPLLLKPYFNDEEWWVVMAVVEAIAEHYKEYSDTLPWLKSCLKHENCNVKRTVVKWIVKNYKNNPEILPWLKSSLNDENAGVPCDVITEIANNYQEDPATLPWLKSCLNHKNEEVQNAAIKGIANNYKKDPTTLPWLKSFLDYDNDNIKKSIILNIANNYREYPETLLLLKTLLDNGNNNVQKSAMAAIASNYKTEPETLYILKSCLNNDNKETKIFAIWEISQSHAKQSETLAWLKVCLTDEDEDVREAALYAIAYHYPKTPELLPLFKDYLDNANPELRWVVVDAIAGHYKDDASTLPMLKSAIQDESWWVRKTAAEALGWDWFQEEGVFDLLYNCACNDPFEREEDWNDNPRQTALAALLRNYGDDARVRALVRDKAENDRDEKLRKYAQRYLRRTQNLFM